jgi:hypothetical protein
MRKLTLTLFTLTTLLLAASAFAQHEAQHDDDAHLAMLRMWLAESSQHGPVLKASDIAPTGVTRTFDITARSFSFTITPQPFAVNQGDTVTINLSVPAGDPAAAHGILMDTYIDGGFDVQRGKTGSVTFVATTANTFAFVCDVPSCGSGHSNMFGSFKVNAVTNPAPSISSVFPVSGPAAGGTTVILSGANFQSSATVTFGGTAATSVNVTSSTSISVVTPAHAAGAVDVVVKNPDNQTGTLTGGFTFSTAPSVSSVNPNSGTTAGGTSVIVTGANFQTGATVTFGGTAAASATVTSATSLTAVTPAHAAGAVDVVVKNPDNQSGTLSGGFTFNTPPVAVLSAAPTSLPVAGGTLLSLNGANLPTSGTATVTVGGASATNVRLIAPGFLVATVPAHAAGTVDIVVIVGGQTFTLTGAVTYVPPPPPRRRAARH